MTLSRILRLLPAILLAGAMVGLWTSARLRAEPAPDRELDQIELLLEIKDRTRTIELRVAQISPFLPNQGLRSKADAIAYEAKRLHDRAEKQLLR